MRKFAFISRHAPTQGQIDLAAELGIEITPIGDLDAFTVTPSMIYDAGPFEGVIVVHPSAAMRLASIFEIGVFENATRPAIDGKPQFEAKALHLYDIVD